MQLELATFFLEVIEIGEIGTNAELHAGIAKGFVDVDAFAGRLQSLAHFDGKEPWRIGHLNMDHRLRSMSDEAGAATEQVTRFSHAGRINVGLRENSASQSWRNLFSVDAIFPGLSSVDRFHERSVAEDECDVLLVAEIGEPIPAEGGFAGDNESITIGSPGEFEFINTAGEFTEQEFGSGVVEDAEVRCSGMEINVSVACMCILEKSHHGLLCEVVE